MKKLIVILLLLSFMISAAACVGERGSFDETGGEEMTTADPSGLPGGTQQTEADGSDKEDKENMKTSYLFAYFRGNEQENLCYGVSRDGRNFRALNGGDAVFTSYLGTKCMRDPFIFEGEDGFFYIVATDMRSALGWNSQSTIVIYKTPDLIEITDGVLINYRKFPGFTRCTRAWAPQVIWSPDHENDDGSRGAYMIYLALELGDGLGTIMYENFTTDLMDASKYTVPNMMISGEAEGKYNGADGKTNGAIDGDIINDTVNGRWLMFFDGRNIAEADNIEGPYKELTEPYAKAHSAPALEGSNMYKLLPKDSGGVDTWMFCADGDAFGNGFCMSSTTDFKRYKTLRQGRDFTFDFVPRHGYVITLTDEQYDRLIEKYGDVSYAGGVKS